MKASTGFAVGAVGLATVLGTYLYTTHKAAAGVAGLGKGYSLPGAGYSLPGARATVGPSCVERRNAMSLRLRALHDVWDGGCGDTIASLAAAMGL